jgi:hypothetical protein
MADQRMEIAGFAGYHECLLCLVINVNFLLQNAEGLHRYSEQFLDFTRRSGHLDR